MQLTETKAMKVAEQAVKAGFYLKRSYEVKLDIARQIKESLNLACTGEEMLEHLTATKPVIKKPVKDLAPSFIGSAQAKERNREVMQGNKFLITYAQNETAVNLPFFNNLKSYLIS